MGSRGGKAWQRVMAEGVRSKGKARLELSLIMRGAGGQDPWP